MSQRPPMLIDVVSIFPSTWNRCGCPWSARRWRPVCAARRARPASMDPRPASQRRRDAVRWRRRDGDAARAVEGGAGRAHHAADPPGGVDPGWPDLHPDDRLRARHRGAPGPGLRPLRGHRRPSHRGRRDEDAGGRAEHRRLRPQRRRGGGPGGCRGGRAAATGGGGQPGVAARRVTLTPARRPAGGSGLHQATGVAGTRSTRGAAQRTPRQDRCLAVGAGLGPDPAPGRPAAGRSRGVGPSRRPSPPTPESS